MISRKLDYFDLSGMISETITELEEMTKCIESKSVSITDIYDKLNSLYVRTKLVVDREEIVKDAGRREVTMIALSGASRLVFQLSNIENYDGPEGFDRELAELVKTLSTFSCAQ